MPELTTSTKPECPVTHDCVWGKNYPGIFKCVERRRRKDGIFQCKHFEQTEFMNTKDLPDPPEELFPDFDYKDKP